MSRKISKIKFVGLHAHSVAGSIFDALGYPQAHMDFCYDNGGEALALTDHGNMNGLAYQVLHAKKMQEEGKDFKPIYGCEAYFIPSIEEWREEYETAMEDKKRARSIKKTDQSGATVEDAASSKKTQDILRRRHHLVLRAQLVDHAREGHAHDLGLVLAGFAHRDQEVVGVNSHAPPLLACFDPLGDVLCETRGAE